MSDKYEQKAREIVDAWINAESVKDAFTEVDEADEPSLVDTISKALREASKIDWPSEIESSLVLERYLTRATNASMWGAYSYFCNWLKERIEKK